MRLSRGWRGLLLFWIGVATCGGIAAMILEILGPTGPNTDVAVREDQEPTVIEFASQVPATSVDQQPTMSEFAGQVPSTYVAAAQVPAETATAVAAATIGPEVPASPPAPQSATIEPKSVVTKMPVEADHTDSHEPSVRTRKLYLRIVRDSEKCPRVMCYKWHLIQQRLKLSHPPTLDMAQLQLAPSIRKAAEKGQVELIIDAVEHHRRINGHDSVIFVATNLAGVMPHDGATSEDRP